MNPDARLPVLTTPGVEYVVRFGGLPYPLDEAEIAWLQAILKPGVKATPWPYLQVGDTVQVEQSAFSGVEGVVTAIKGESRLVVSIHMLQRSVAVELDRSWIKPAPGVNALMPRNLPPCNGGSMPQR